MTMRVLTTHKCSDQISLSSSGRKNTRQQSVTHDRSLDTVHASDRNTYTFRTVWCNPPHHVRTSSPRRSWQPIQRTLLMSTMPYELPLAFDPSVLAQLLQSSSRSRELHDREATLSLCSRSPYPCSEYFSAPQESRDAQTESCPCELHAPRDVRSHVSCHPLHPVLLVIDTDVVQSPHSFVWLLVTSIEG